MRSCADVRKKLDKSYPKTIYVGEAIEGIKVPRLTTGSFVFDMITGGGIPKNRISLFHGPKSSSKTTFALRVAGMFQQLHPDLKVLFMDFELTFDWAWAGRYILDRDRIEVVRPDYGEVGVDIVKAYAAEAEDIGLIIVDSLAGITPTKETEAGAADYTQLGLQVRLINRMIRNILPLMSQADKAGRQMTVLCINQVRANMNKSGPYGPAYSQPCGKLLEHAASLDVRFYTGEYTKVRGVPVKVKHTFQVEKNKVGLPKRSGDLVYYLTDYNGYQPGELEEERAVLIYARRANVVVTEGKKIVIHGLKKPVEFDKLEEVQNALREDRKLFAAVKTLTLRACLKNPFVGADEKE